MRTHMFKSNKIYFKILIFFFILINSSASEEIKIPKLGNFLSKTKKERYGRNPKTGEHAVINKRKVVKFKSSKLLKSKINK